MKDLDKNNWLVEVMKTIGEYNTNALEQISKLINVKQEKSVLKEDTRYVYDNIRPTILAEPDRDVWIKRDDIKENMEELIQAQGKNAINSLESINDPTLLTKIPKNEYGLTDEMSRWLLEFIFCVEGGYFNHPNDPGGETMYGIIKSEARKFGYEGQMKMLPKELATMIYQKKYWRDTGLMNITNFGKALTIFDFQVNSGTRGCKIAQKTANKLYEHKFVDKNFRELMKDTNPLSIDGVLGEKSFDMINKIPTLEYLLSYVVFQEDQYEDLMRANPKLRVFDEGWENRIVKKNIFLGTMLRQNVFSL